jgi:hypothetical protein
MQFALLFKFSYNFSIRRDVRPEPVPPPREWKILDALKI